MLRDFLSEYLPEEHSKRDKTILSPGLIKNFGISDIEIVKKEYNNSNKTLLQLINKEQLDEIIRNFETGKQITEKDLIILQMFVSANTFLNIYNF